MTTGEGANADGGAHDDKDRRKDGGERDERSQRINVGSGDDAVTRIQLAARWAESYGPRADSLEQVLKRFRAAYEYLDAVTHGVEPAGLDRDLWDARPSAPAKDAMQTPAAHAPAPSPEPAPTPAQAEPRPWG
jgi:hypothetical protein